MFCTWLVTLWKSSFPMNPPPPHPSEFSAFELPFPLGISNDLLWGWGGGGGGGEVWIFSVTTQYLLNLLLYNCTVRAECSAITDHDII